MLRSINAVVQFIITIIDLLDFSFDNKHHLTNRINSTNNNNEIQKEEK